MRCELRSLLAIVDADEHLLELRYIHLTRLAKDADQRASFPYA